MGKIIAVAAALVAAVVLGGAVVYMMVGSQEDRSFSDAREFTTRAQPTTSTQPTSIAPTPIAPTPIAPSTTAPTTNQSVTGEGQTRCDGRGVLIVQSILDYGDNVQSEYQAALAKYPNSELIRSGTCASLRPVVDGVLVHAVVVDYGRDIAGLCSAAAQLGGNPRILKNEVDYSSPC